MEIMKKNTHKMAAFLIIIFILMPAVQITADTAGDSETAQKILNEISLLMEKREFDAALKLFDSLNETISQTPDLQLLKASIFNSSGQPRDARAIASSILASQPNNIEALFVLAASASIEGKEKEHRTLLERVLKIDPKNLKAMSDLGYIALTSKSLRVAANQFEKALTIDGNYLDALVGRAIVYKYVSEPKKAEQLLNKAINLSPLWATPLHERARLYKGAGYLEDALRDFDEAKKLDPYNYWISTDRAVTLVELSRKEEALTELNNAVNIDSKGFLAYVYRAGINDEIGNYKQAEEDYLLLTKIKPDYYFAAEGLGIIRMRNGQYMQARDAFLLAYRQAPKEFRYALLASINWMKAGKPDDPKQFLAQVLRTVPRDSPDWYLLRLYHDLKGDSDAAAKADQEKNLNEKSRMLFYLACFYYVRGNIVLANNYFLQVKDMNRMNIIEWKINEIMLENLGIKDY